MSGTMIRSNYPLKSAYEILVDAVLPLLSDDQKILLQSVIVDEEGYEIRFDSVSEVALHCPICESPLQTPDEAHLFSQACHDCLALLRVELDPTLGDGCEARVTSESRRALKIVSRSMAQEETS